MTGIKLEEWRQALLEVPAMQELAQELQAEGVEQGKQTERLNIAKAMLAEKIEMGLIVKLTGLTKDEVAKLR